MKKNRFTHNR